jgi:hypothetical protein
VPAPSSTWLTLFDGVVGPVDSSGSLTSQMETSAGDHPSVNHEKVQQFVSQRAPRYRPILSRISEAQLNIDPEISDKELDLALHRHFASIESELLAEGHDLMAENPSETIDEYTLKLEAYLFSGPYTYVDFAVRAASRFDENRGWYGLFRI